ncbi:MAG: transposase [Candidatus Bathyarchaeota archaeon]|nr:MAG: transposase [Candidatus Bathyarchaeota archaeon]
MFDKWIFPDNWQVLVIAICTILHQRSAWRLNIIIAGIVFAKGRKTITSWFRAAGITQRHKAFYYFIGSIGKKTEIIATVLVEFMVKLIYNKDNKVLMGIDDGPTKRYGPKVQGAGIHRNPTVGPDGAKFIYGHVWVTLSALVRHSRWGTIGLPLLARMYIRAKDVGSVPKDCGIGFQNKLQQAAELVKWAAECCKSLQKELWVVTDGGYTRAGFIKPAIRMGATIITRLRKDAALYSLVKPPKKRKPGRPRKYGQRIDLRSKAANKSGWFSIDVTLYGRQETKWVKMFKATYRPAGGEILVLIVREADDFWRAFMCTNLSATAQQILEAVADRSAIEQNFHDLKQVEGAGQQQVRSYWTNVGVFHLNMWVHTMIELWAWNEPVSVICDRSSSPWDDPARRPSHADRRGGLRCEVLKKIFFETFCHDRKTQKIVRQFYKLMKLAA